MCVLPVVFVALSQQHYATSEDGALVSAAADGGFRAALCRETEARDAGLATGIRHR